MRAIIGLLCLWCGSLTAAPTGADLLRACEESLSNGFTGVAGQMCEWYARPCQCDVPQGEYLPQVCLPASVPVEVLAGQLISALRREQSLQQRSAAAAVLIVLSRHYPCRG